MDTACIISLKERVVRLEYQDENSRLVVRFETRGKEFNSVARLRKRSHSESEALADSRRVGVKAPESQG